MGIIFILFIIIGFSFIFLGALCPIVDQRKNDKYYYRFMIIGIVIILITLIVGSLCGIFSINENKESHQIMFNTFGLLAGTIGSLIILGIRKPNNTKVWAKDTRTKTCIGLICLILAFFFQMSALLTSGTFIIE